MLYTWDITITADTKKNDPKKQELKLSHGVVTKVSIKFPAGCVGMVGVRLMRYESAIVPVGKDTWVTGDDESVDTPDYYELTDVPYEFTFHGHSEGTSFNHTVGVRITVLPHWAAAPYLILQDFIKVIKRLLGVV